MFCPKNLSSKVSPNTRKVRVLFKGCVFNNFNKPNKLSNPLVGFLLAEFPTNRMILSLLLNPSSFLNIFLFPIRNKFSLTPLGMFLNSTVPSLSTDFFAIEVSH